MEAARDLGPGLCCKPGGRLDMSHGFVHHIRRNQIARDDYDKKVKQAAKEKARRRHTPAPTRPRKPDLQVYLPRHRDGSAHLVTPDCEESGESSSSGSSELEPPGRQLFCLEYEADSGEVTSVIVYQARAADDCGRNISRYAMAVMNRHVCPVENWSYNESCSPDPAEQGGPKTCCTLDDVPLISKCGTYPPESCLFSLIGNVGAFMVALICLLRYGQLLEQSRHSWINTTALITGCTNAAGLVVVGNFQVDHAKSLHYIGAGVAFPAGLLFVCLQCVLFYHGATTTLDLAMAHLRSVLAVIAFVTLVLSGVFFLHESSQLQHGAALCEWVFVLDILIFYGTFSYEFGAISSDTLVAALQPAPGRACKSSGSSSTSTHLNCAPESIAMI
ncbi:hypothetical protein STEG23_007793 [Scotinomys teguina]